MIETLNLNHLQLALFYEIGDPRVGENPSPLRDHTRPRNGCNLACGEVPKIDVRASCVREKRDSQAGLVRA